MRFAVGVAATLAVAAEALPRGPSHVFLPREDSDDNSTSPIPNEPVNDGVLDTCEDVGSKNQDSWVDNEVGDWFVKMASKQEEYTEDIQKTVQSWAKGGDIYGFHCDPMEDCSPSFPVQECKEDPINAAIYFILWSTSYFNKWVTSLVRAVDTTSGIATGKAPKIADTFSTDPDTIELNTAPAVLAAGFLGTFGALVPGAFGTVGGLGSSLATIAVGAMSQINNDQEIELEPKFNTFEDVSDYIADSTENMIKGLEAFANHVLVDTPEHDPDDDVYFGDDPTGLPQILKDGTFTESVSVSVLDERIYTSIFSGAITTVWRKEGAMIVKVHSDEPTLDEAPCDTDGFFDDRLWCSDDGTAYVLLKHPGKNKWYDNPMNSDTIDDFKDVPGADDIGDYGISIETIARGSERAADLNDGKPYYEWDADATIDHLKENPDDVVDFSTFNLPICELDTTTWDGSFWDVPPIDDDDCGAECQILYRMSYCYSGWGLDDEYGIIFWEDECDFNSEKCDNFCMPGGFVGSDCD